MKKILAAIAAFVVICSGSASAESLTLATLNWPPFYAEDLPENGFFAALSREAFKRAGYDMELKFMTWNRALELSKKGKYDGILGAYYNADRETHFIFTAPVSQNQESFIRKTGSDAAYTGMEALKAYKIGGLMGAAPLKELKANGITAEGTADELGSMKKLNAGRIDLLVMGKQNLYWALNNDSGFKPFKGKVEVIEPPFKSYDLFCPITRKRDDAAQIVEKFNAALAAMKADGTYKTIMDRFGQK